ncbi:MAG: N-acetylmuramoyl-L-alanine amidase [Clostridiales bacterium]|nr:N-acetylmuramoyl-L-alanine amidase [Clostridiales bacterium]
MELGTHNTTASAGRSIKYIVIHYTAGVSSVKGKAANTAEYFASTANQTSADFIVDDETIVQYNPDLENRYCWHCGGSELSTKGGSLHGVAKNLDLYAGW